MHPVKSMQRAAAGYKSTSNAKEQYSSRLADILLDIRQQAVAALKEKLRPAKGFLAPVTRSNAKYNLGSVALCVTAQQEDQAVEAHFCKGQDSGWFPAKIVTVSNPSVGKCVIVKWSDGDLRDTAKSVRQIRFPV